MPDKPTDILVMPHFSGAANPYMDSRSKAAVIGLTFEHTKYDLYRALMEGATYEIMVNIECLESFGIHIKKLIATGGGAASEEWLKIKADILGRTIISLYAKEAGTCGTCMITAAAVGACKDLDEARRIFVREKNVYMPETENAEKYKKNYKAYKRIYKAACSVTEVLYE